MKFIPLSRFAMGSYQYIRYPFEYFLDTAVRLGYQNIELWAAAPHLYPDSLNTGKRHQIKQELINRGLNVYCLTPEMVVYPFNLSSENEDLRNLSLRYFKSILELAADLEAPAMMIAAGCGYFNQAVDEARKRGQEGVYKVAEYAKTLGIRLFFETLTPLSSNLVNSPQQLADILSGLPDNVGGMADFGQIAFMKQNLEDYFTFLGSKLWHIHVQDSGEAIHMALGEGRLSVDKYIERIEASGYTGMYSLEINDIRYRKDPALADEKSVQWLKDHGVVAG